MAVSSHQVLLAIYTVIFATPPSPAQGCSKETPGAVRAPGGQLRVPRFLLFVEIRIFSLKLELNILSFLMSFLNSLDGIGSPH